MTPVVTPTPGTGALCAFGDGALLITTADTPTAQSLAAHLRHRRLAGVVDVVAGLRTVLVALDLDLDPGPGAERGAAIEPGRGPDSGRDGGPGGGAGGGPGGGPGGGAGGGPGGGAGQGSDGMEDAPLLAAAGRLPGGEALHAVLAELATAAATAGRATRPARVWEVATTFDGPDLLAVAEQCGMGVGDVVGALTAAELRVEVLGFSPGFAYLGGLAGPLAHVARRAVPRPAVSAGSVALANGYAAVYPQDTPGGWQVVGHTSLRVFDPGAIPPVLWQPGDGVRFAVDRGDGPRAPAVTPGRSARRAGGSAGGAAALLVEDAGFLTLLEDGGRFHAGHLGVPRAGPADRVAHSLANRLVGNRAGTTALEVTVRGPSLRCLTDVHVAVVGGAVPEIDGRPAAAGAVVPVTAGQRLTIGRTGGSLRAVVAVAGGLQVPSVLDSHSTDTLSWTGPAPLAVGDALWVGPRRGPLGGHLPGLGPATGHFDGDAGWTLRVLAGPHPDWFDVDVLEQLRGTVFVVDPASDRVGLRLVPADGAGALRRRAGELASQPMVTGAVQVPPSGAPVVLGPDHATLGGYPVVATVIAADLCLAGRCRPGDRVGFALVDASTARAARRRQLRALGQAVQGHYPTASGT